MTDPELYARIREMAPNLGTQVTAEERAELVRLVAEAERRASSKFRCCFPDTGPYARDRYPKQLEFASVNALSRRCREPTTRTIT
jgi:hypothetical protein